MRCNYLQTEKVHRAKLELIGPMVSCHYPRECDYMCGLASWGHLRDLIGHFAQVPSPGFLGGPRGPHVDHTVPR